MKSILTSSTLRYCANYFIIFGFSVIASIKTGETKSYQGVYVAGDIILGGLFPVHEKSKYQDVPCSHKVYNRGIQRLEAMLYAIDTINQDPNLLKDVKLGVNIRDTCGRDTFALNQSLEFIRSSLNTFDVNQYECNGGGVPRLKFNTTGPILGVIGGSYSSVSIQVANLLRLFRIPQISPASTAKALSDKSRFDLFARTVPPDTFQAIALVDIVKKFNWTYVSTIASEGSYGESGIDVFQREAEKRNICIAIAEKVPSDANDAKFNEVVGNLLKKPNAKAVVLFTRAEDARGILKAARRLLKREDPNNSSAATYSSAQKFYWLASDGWGKQSQVVSGIEDFAVGAITVELESKRIAGFDEYMNTLTPEDNERNHWFRDYWEDLFECDIDHRPTDDGRKRRRRHNENVEMKFDEMKFDEMHHLTNDIYESPKDIYLLKSNDLKDDVKHVRHRRQDENSLEGSDEKLRSRRGRRKLCNPQLRLANLPNYEQDSKIQFVIDAVYAFAHALDALKADICPTWKGVCPAMVHYDGGMFYKKYLLKVDFEDMAKSKVKFDEKGDGLARYTIYNYQKNVADNSFDYKVVGKWYNELNMHESDVLWDSSPPTTDTKEIPNSVCSFPCKTGEIMIMNTGDTCCWICQKCQDFEYMVDEFNCQDCGNGKWPHENKTSCFELPMKYMRWETVFAIVPVCIACVGIVLTVATIVVFIKFADTPLVRASGRELSYVILAGLLLCYLNTFILLAKPGVVVCMLQRFSVGMGFSFVYGALLTKTNRISRIFHSASQSARRPSYISPRSQLIITSILASVQFLGTLVWIVVALPKAESVYPHRSEVILKCNINDSSFLFSQVYNMILITICTYYAVMTRKVPENFNEAKFIGFTMYTTCIIWLAFIPIYFGTGNSFEIQITTLCISISLSAYTTLFCLFSPKLYIIVFQPDKNVRKLTMNSGVQKKAGGTLMSTAASAAIAANRFQNAANQGLNFTPSQNNGSSQGSNVTKAQVMNVKSAPATLADGSSREATVQIETIVPAKAAVEAPKSNSPGPNTTSSNNSSSGLAPSSVTEPAATSSLTNGKDSVLKKSTSNLSTKEPHQCSNESSRHCLKVEGCEGHTKQKRLSFLCDKVQANEEKATTVQQPETEPIKVEQEPLLNDAGDEAQVTPPPSYNIDDEPVQQDQEEEEDDAVLSLTSPGTPCSQCLRDEQEASLQHTSTSHRQYLNGDHSAHVTELGHHSSEEECCSIESDSVCCSCDEHQSNNKKSLKNGQNHDASHSESSHIINEKSAAAADQSSHHNKHSKFKDRMPQSGDSVANGDAARQLVTYVTPGMETVPLEMCQDIPDVMI